MGARRITFAVQTYLQLFFLSISILEYNNNHID